MNNQLHEIALHPNCILAVTPEMGGSWISLIRQPQLRNFAANPIRWGSNTALQAAVAAIGSGDWKFELTFKIGAYDLNHRNLWVWTWGNSTIEMNDSESVMVVQINSESQTKLFGINFAYERRIPASVIIERSGTTISFSAVQNGIEIKNHTATIPDTSVFFLQDTLTTNVGNIINAKLSYGNGLSWQASYSDLYDMTNPQPSPVPRNFTSAECRWYDAVNEILSLGTDDLEFYIQYRLDGHFANINSLFYFNSQNGSINLAFLGDGTTTNYSYIKLNGINDYVIPLDLMKQLGTHSIRIRRIGTTVTIEFDETVIDELTTNEVTSVIAGIYPISYFNGVIYDCYWKNLRTNQKVWHYPNDAEKVQLITNNNIKTENGQFEQANPSYEARLDTALDLRGKISSYTTIVDFDTVPFTISVAGQKQELAGQGPSVAYGAQYKVICSIGHGSSGNMQLSQEIAGARQIIAANPGKVEGRYILAGVVQLDIPNNTTRLALYFNGELLVEQTFAGLPTGTTHAAYTNFAIWDNRNGAYTQMYGAVHGVFLLDTALDDAQLKVLTAP